MIKTGIEIIKGAMAYTTEREKGNINPIPSGIVSILGYDYIKGYPASFYFLFKKKPSLKIDLLDINRFDDETKHCIVNEFIKNKTSSLTIEPNVLNTVILYSRIKNYSRDCKIKSANFFSKRFNRCLFIEDDDYIYEVYNLNRYTKEAFNKVFNPKDIKDETDSKIINAISSFITHDKEEAMDDAFTYGDPKLLDDFCEEVVIDKKDRLSLGNNILALREDRLNSFLKEINYEYKSGMIIIKSK